MKRFLLLLGTITLVTTASADWTKDLVDRNPGLIDSVIPADASTDTCPNLKSYTIYYHQPIVHTDAQSSQFSLRAHLTVRTDQPIETAGMLVQIGGYNNKNTAEETTLALYADPKGSIHELSSRYHLHMLTLEHRYFSYSTPYQPWTKAEGLKAVEAAADFHAIIAGVKKVFTSGRYMMAGVSKGGITTAMQGLFYPEDANYYVPYAAPFCDSIEDPRQAQYMQSTGWDEALRNRMHALQTEAITSNDVIAEAMRILYKPEEKQDTCAFYDYVATFELNHHAYYSAQAVTAYLDRFNQVSDSLVQQQRGTRSQHLAYIMCWSESDSVNYLQRLNRMIVEYSRPTAPTHRNNPRRLTVDSATIADAYMYQAYTELGTYLLDPIFFFPENQKAKAQAIWNKRDLIAPQYKSLQYTSTLRNSVMDKMGTFPGKMVFLYGEDDHWTGAAMEDKYINSITTYKYILPQSNHVDGINHLYEFGDKYKALADEIWALLDASTSVEEIEPNNNTYTYRKVIINGQLYIIRDGKTFDALGRMIQ